MTKLQRNYISACNDYLKKFCKRYEFHYEPDGWVSGKVGTIINLADYFFSMGDIIYCVDNRVEWRDISDWYDCPVEAGSLGVSFPNLENFIKGCPRGIKK